MAEPRRLQAIWDGVLQSPVEAVTFIYWSGEPAGGESLAWVEQLRRAAGRTGVTILDLDREIRRRKTEPPAEVIGRVVDDAIAELAVRETAPIEPRFFEGVRDPSVRAAVCSELTAWYESAFGPAAPGLLTFPQAVDACWPTVAALDVFAKNNKRYFKHGWPTRKILPHVQLINRLEFTRPMFAGRRVLEIGPGSYAFAMIARSLGAEVTVIEPHMIFASAGRALGFPVEECDAADLARDGGMRGARFDGIWS